MDTEDKAIVRHMFRLGRTAEEIVLYLGYSEADVKREMRKLDRPSERRVKVEEPIGMDEFEHRQALAAASNDLFVQRLAQLGSPAYA